MQTLSIASILALTSLSLAQSVVDPVHFTHSEAFSTSAIPIGSPTVPYRTLQIHSGVPAGTIRGLAFRLDVLQTAAVPAFAAVMEVSMSTALTTPAAPSGTFDNNHGPDRVVVLPQTVVQFPAAPAGGLAPKDFLYVITFAVPFVHAGTAPLCWDMKISNRSSTTSFSLDYVQTSTNPAPNVVAFGTGCTATGQASRMTLAATASTSWTSRTLAFIYTGTRLPPNAVVSLSVGVSATSILGLPLPLALPGSSGAPSGTCTIYNDSLIQVPVFTTSTGALATGSNIALTINPAMNGANLFTQVLAFDAAANPIGIISSNSLQQHLVAPLTVAGVGNVTRSGSVLPTGTVAANRGTVTRFDY